MATASSLVTLAVSRELIWRGTTAETKNPSDVLKLADVELNYELGGLMVGDGAPQLHNGTHFLWFLCPKIYTLTTGYGPVHLAFHS